MSPIVLWDLQTCIKENYIRTHISICYTHVHTHAHRETETESHRMEAVKTPWKVTMFVFYPQVRIYS